MFELVHLRSFVAVAEELHFGRAANRLQITQPPLSRQISLLEHQLGARLFDRSNRRVEMTPAGRAFLPEARQLLRLAESAMLSVRRAEQGEAGRLAISFTASAGYDFLPRTLRRLRRDLPGVSFILREMVSVDQLDALDARLVDIALPREVGGAPPPAPRDAPLAHPPPPPPPVRRPGLESRCVLREKLVVGVPGRHRLARRSEAGMADLADEPMITYSASEGRYLSGVVARLLDRANLAPDYVEAVSQVHTALALVRAGLGIVIAPEAARQLHFSDVSLVPLVTPPDFSADLHSAWRSDNDNPILAGALRIIEGVDAAHGRA